MTPMQLHLEQAKLKEENKRYPDNILEAKIKKQYGVDDWLNVADEDLTEEQSFI